MSGLFANTIEPFALAMKKLFRRGVTAVAAAVLLLCAAGAHSFADQSDARLLKLLETKNLLSSDEVSYLKKMSSGIGEDYLLSPDSLNAHMMFYVQPRYTYVSQNFSGAETYSCSGFNLRRVLVCFYSQISADTRVGVALNFTNPTLPLFSATTKTNVDTKYLRGILTLGFMPAPFGMDKPVSASMIYATERSIPSNYLGGSDWYYVGGYRNSYNSRLCLAGGHLGAYWFGEIEGSPVTYCFAVTNSQSENIGTDYGNDISLWAYLRVRKDLSEDINVYFGANGAFANKLMGILPAGSLVDGICSEYVSSAGVNPFAILTWRKNTRIETEMMFVHMQNGKSLKNDIPWYTAESPDAMPIALVATLSHKIELDFFDFEPIARYSYLNTDGRGVRPSEVCYGLVTRDGMYNVCNAVYAGFNWYLNEHHLKIYAGYTYADFRGSPVDGADKSSAAHIISMQLQARF